MRRKRNRVRKAVAGLLVLGSMTAGVGAIAGAVPGRPSPPRPETPPPPDMDVIIGGLCDFSPALCGKRPI